MLAKSPVTHQPSQSQHCVVKGWYAYT